jgi:hypothetical protein
MSEHNIILNQIPSKLTGYLNSVILPRKRFKKGDTFPKIDITRRGFKIDEKHLSEFQKMCGWDDSEYMPFIYPLVVVFHYHLGIFAHRNFPWSLRMLLGLRNHVVQRRRIKVGETLDLSARTLGLRVGLKGLEFDIHTRISSGGEAVWESVHVYYLRGNFGGRDIRPVADYLQPLDSSEFQVSWDAPSAGGLEFARLSGDLNPAHYFKPWARLLGFKRDFCHTQRIISDCIQRLPNASDVMDLESLRLDIAFKGPVYYGSKLMIRGAGNSNGIRFNLYSGTTDKPAMPGNIQEIKADYDLLAGLGYASRKNFSHRMRDTNG